jgi:membrane-bound metal-dependent hydrolase YbcI (DUF457 family)
MPFTYFHFGPALLIGLILYRYLDFPTFVAANVLTDWRAFLVFFGFWPPPRHSWVHTYLGSFACALIFSAAMLCLRPKLGPLMNKLRVDSDYSREKLVYSALSGVTVHVTLDAFHHPTMNPFYPIMEKPLYGIMSGSEVTLFASFLGLLAIPVYGWHLAGRPTQIMHKKENL